MSYIIESDNSKIEKSNKRIFLLGDSFTNNLYQSHYQIYKKNGNICNSEIQKYIELLINKNIKFPKYFDDWLSEWGYDIYNFAKAGCSIQDTIHQFLKIDKEFKEGDRLIINLTSFQRFNWVSDTGHNRVIHNTGTGHDSNNQDIINFFLQQSINREYSFNNNAYIKTHEYEFLIHLIQLYKKYNPIIWSVCGIDEVLNCEKYFTYSILNQIFHPYIKHSDKLRIDSETNFYCSDYHFGRYGNYYTALLFKTILEHTGNNEYYMKDENLLNKIFFTFEKDEIFFELPKFI